MKISNELGQSNSREITNESTDTTPERFTVVKNLNSLTSGDKFKAHVVDIKPNQVTIRLASGESLTAKSLMLPEARIGDETVFLVKENNKGQIFLEMLKPEGNTLQNNIAREALVGAKLYPNSENMDLVKKLMDNKLPIDASTLQKALFFYYSKGDMSMDEVMFLLKENFPPNGHSVEMLNHSLDRTFHLKNDVTEFIHLIFSLPDEALSDEIIDKFTSAFEKHDPEFAVEMKKAGTRKDIAEALARRLFIDLHEKDGLTEANKYYKALYEAVSNTKKSLEQAGVKDETMIRATNIRDNLEFMNHIGNYKEYMQIPFRIGTENNQGELYIFKDAKGRRNYAEQASVLIALDYNTLGRIEVFVNKTRNDLSFQFKSGDDAALKLIQRSVQTLSTALKEKGFSITGCSYKKLDEPFQITDDMIQYDTSATGTKRYAFDMRV